MEEQIRGAIVTELKRQSEDPECHLDFSHAGDRIAVDGEIDLGALVFVIVGPSGRKTFRHGDYFSSLPGLR